MHGKASTSMIKDLYVCVVTNATPDCHRTPLCSFLYSQVSDVQEGRTAVISSLTLWIYTSAAVHAKLAGSDGSEHCRRCMKHVVY